MSKIVKTIIIFFLSLGVWFGILIVGDGFGLPGPDEPIFFIVIFGVPIVLSLIYYFNVNKSVKKVPKTLTEKIGIFGIGLVIFGCITPYMYVSALGVNKSNYFINTVDNWMLLFLIPSVLNVIKPKLIGKYIAIGTSLAGLLIFFFKFIELTTNNFFPYDPEIGSFLLLAGFAFMTASTFDFSPNKTNYTNIQENVDASESDYSKIDGKEKVEEKPNKVFDIKLQMIDEKLVNIWQPPDCDLSCYKTVFRIKSRKNKIKINLQFSYEDVNSIDTLPLNKAAAKISLSENRMLQMIFKTPGDAKSFKSISMGPDGESDITLQIEKLHELKEKGALTDEEFQEKKKDLLKKL